jgi:adenylate cyclase
MACVTACNALQQPEFTHDPRKHCTMPIQSRRFFMRLRPSIVGLFLLLAIPLFMATVWFGYTTNDRIARDTANLLTEKARFETFNSTLELLEPIKALVKVAARLGEAESEFFRKPESSSYLNEMLTNSSHISSAYVAFEDGSFRMILRVQAGSKILNTDVPVAARTGQRWLDRKGVAEPMDAYGFFDDQANPIGEIKASAVYDPRVRPWYKESVAAGKKLSISDPYIFATTGLAGITISMPFFANEKLVGVVAVDITLDNLSRFLASRPVSAGSISLIIDDDDRIVAHPDPAQSVRREDGKLIQNNLSRLTNALPAYAMASRPDKTTERFTFVHSKTGEEYVAMLSKLPDTLGKSWRVMIIAPLADFSRVWTENNNKLLIFGALAIVLEVLLISVLSRLISRPIEQLETRILDVQNFSDKVPERMSSRIPEINSLIHAVETLDSTIKAFASFVPKGLVHKLMNSTQKLELGGSSRFLTIFFSDLESFSTLAESSPARELLARISAYFEAVTRSVNEESGTIDKFIGDGVMAFWGAPELLDDHAYHSCVAALKVLKKMEKLNASWEEQGLGPLKVRIGIHCDSVLVGNVGSAERMSYTVMGDGVNLAARLEGVNKEYGTQICVSHSVFKEAGERLWLRPISVVTVKGRRAEMEIYELVGIRGGDPALQASPAQIRLCEWTAQAYEAYRSGNIDAALTAYQDLLVEYPDDSVAKQMLAVCQKTNNKLALIA